MILKQGKTNRKYILIVLILAVIVGGGILYCCRWKKSEIPFIRLPETANWETYQSPDSLLHAQIIPIGATKENKIQIRTNEDVLLQEADYSSEDGDHGLRVARAEWTPDSQFFIYSAYSSGGHQPWFSRVYFYSRSDNKIYNFTEVSGFTVASDEFIVVAPDIVTFTVYTSVGMGPTTTKSFELSEIISTLEWQTYRDEEYGFEFKYPTNWEFSKTKYPEIMESYAFSVEFGPKGARYEFEESCCIFPIEIYIWKSPPPVVATGEKETNHILNNLPAIKTKTYMELGKVLTIEKPNKYGYYFEIVNYFKYFDENVKDPRISENILNGMLSTFRFLE